MGQKGLWLVCSALLWTLIGGAAPKLPNLREQQVLKNLGQHHIQDDSPAGRLSHHFIQAPHMPEEDMPLSFERLHPVEALSSDTQTVIKTGASTAFNDVVTWRPDDLHFVTTRSQAWEASAPHKAAGNCHISRIRALSRCPNQCSGNGYCGVTAGQRGFKYIPSDLPGECHCAPGWLGADCSLEKAMGLSAILVESGNSRSDTIAQPGNVIRITIVSPENLRSVDVKRFKVGGKDAAGFVVVPESGKPPCMVWSVGYLVEEDDFGPLTFTLEYKDARNRTGIVSSQDAVVRGNVTVTSFAAGAKYWRIRSLSISKGGMLQDFAWRVSYLRFVHPMDASQQNIAVLASSENITDCGFMGTCQNLTTTRGTRYRFKVNFKSGDSTAMTYKLIDYPSHGFGKRVRDSKSKKYFGMVNVTTCASACDQSSECYAFTFSSSTKNPGCFLHSILEESLKQSLEGQTLYIKEAQECPKNTLLACNGACISDRTCQNASLHHQVGLNKTSCLETIGHDTCLGLQSLWWNCPLHGCNDNACKGCGINKIPFGKDLVNGKAVNAFDDYASHYWQAGSNSAGEWIAVAFPEYTNVTSVYVRHPDIRNIPMSAVVEQSNDFVNWMPVVVMDDFASLEYATDLPDPKVLATANLNQVSSARISYEELEDQLLVELGLEASGKVIVPTVMFCYYALDANGTTNFNSFATYDEPIPQIASKFYVPRNSSLIPLPRDHLSMLAQVPSCENSEPDWKDYYGDSCSDYERNKWCTIDGTSGPGWQSEWGELEDYARDGKSAFDQCCGCGGGRKLAVTVQSSPTPMPECVDFASWIDKIGQTCENYAENSLCKPDGNLGAGWNLQKWGSIQDYAREGVTALEACCSCGGGHRTRVLPGPDSRREVLKAQKQLEQFSGEFLALTQLSSIEVTTEDMLKTDLDDFGCDNTLGFTWCPYSMKCVQDYEGGIDGPCKPPDAPITAPTVPATTFSFHDESRQAGKLKGKITILAAYRDYQNNQITEYAVYFCKSEAGLASEVIGSALLVIPKGAGIVSGIIPLVEIPAQATHIAVFTRNQGIPMAFGITKRIDEQLNIYADDIGSYHTQTCAIWRRNGPAYHSIQGLTFSPMQNFYRGKNMTIRIGGNFFCSDTLDAASTHIGRGNATVQWVIFHSPDGTNQNSRVLPQSEGSTQLAMGTFNVSDGQCVGYPNGIAVKAFANQFQGGYISIWFKLDWRGPDNGEDYALVCDGLTYEIAQGVGVTSIQAEKTKDGNTFYCAGTCPQSGNDPFMVLQYYPRTTFRGGCDSDEGKICVKEWIGDGCGSNPPYLFGYDCESYRRCYVDAMADGRCGEDKADSNCNSEEARDCIDAWIAKGCPDKPAKGCYQFEECAIQASLSGRCPAKQIDCNSTSGRFCIDSWVRTNCTEYPPGGNKSCVPYEVCAPKAVQEGRCGKAKNISSCASEEGRTCVDAFVRAGCPAKIPTVPGLDCESLKPCIDIAVSAGRCKVDEPDFGYAAPPKLEAPPDEEPTAPPKTTVKSTTPSANDTASIASDSVSNTLKAISSSVGESVAAVGSVGNKAVTATASLAGSTVSAVGSTLNSGAQATTAAVGQVFTSGTSAAQAGATAVSGTLSAGATSVASSLRSVGSGFVPSHTALAHNSLIQKDQEVKGPFRNLLRHRPHNRIRAEQITEQQLQQQLPPTQIHQTLVTKLPLETPSSRKHSISGLSHHQTNQVAPHMVDSPDDQPKHINKPPPMPVSEIDWKAENEANRRKWAVPSDLDFQSNIQSASTTLENEEDSGVVTQKKGATDWVKKNQEARMKWASRTQ